MVRPDPARLICAAFAQEPSPATPATVRWANVGVYLDQLSISAEYGKQHALVKDAYYRTMADLKTRASAEKEFNRASNSGPPENMLAGIVGSVQYLRGRWLAGAEVRKPIPAVCARSLELYSVLLNAAELKELAGIRLTDQQAASMLESVAEDPDIKARHCRQKGLTNPERIRGLVRPQGLGERRVHVGAVPAAEQPH